MAKLNLDLKAKDNDRNIQELTNQPEILTVHWVGGSSLNTGYDTLRGTADYSDISLKTPTGGRPKCLCGGRMFWDRFEGEWECLCGKRRKVQRDI